MIYGKGIWKLKCKKDQIEEKKNNPPFTPGQHQLEVMNYFFKVTMTKSIYKGLMVYHRLGAGKTCSGFITADKLLRHAKVKNVYVLTPGSLRSNWVDEYCKKCGYSPEFLKKYYTFITYNYSVGTAVTKMDFNDSIVIIDEIHNVIRGVINAYKDKNDAKKKSKTAYKIYQKLLSSNCKILALSGTPVFNHIYEWAVLGNLLKPGAFPNIFSYDDVDTEEFMDLFEKDQDGIITAKNPLQFQVRLKGIISYYAGSKENFPELREMEPIRIRATKPQEEYYWHQQYKQDRLKSGPNEAIKFQDVGLYNFLLSQQIRAALFQFTRSVANFYYPPEYRAKYKSKNFKPKTGKIEPDDIKEADEVADKGRKDLPVNKDGWVSKVTFANPLMAEVYSTKFVAFFVNFLLHFNTKHVLFTFFKNKSGVLLISTLLGMCGVKTAIYSGDIGDSDRRKILKKFNSPENLNGEIIKILLVTGAGAEGISIMETNHFHILESEPNVNTTTQAIGRVARFKSHTRLPPERRYVKIWRYWTTSNVSSYTIKVEVKNPDTGKKELRDKTYENTIMVDEFLYKRGVVKTNEIQSFLALLQQASVTS